MTTLEISDLHVSVRLDGDLNVEALERALSELVRRHEVLRSTFHESSTGPVQRVSSEAARASSAAAIAMSESAAQIIRRKGTP